MENGKQGYPETTAVALTSETTSTLTVESHLSRLQPCSQILNLGITTLSDKHASLLQQILVCCQVTDCDLHSRGLHYNNRNKLDRLPQPNTSTLAKYF
jgi:hypothetical protein